MITTPTAIDSLHIRYLEQIKAIDSTENGQDVRQGLQQGAKTLPPRYFYDEKGSLLFEDICNLPEYYPTRTEAGILQEYALEIASITGNCELVELGSGSSSKTRFLLNAYQTLYSSLNYVPIDVSGEILAASAKQLLSDYSTLKVRGLVGTYEQALAQLTPSSLPTRIILFLGSTLGNFYPQQSDRFLAQIINALQPGDYFLLGVDLQKPKAILEAAYNDSQGVTAAFNLNMLAHLNWRFRGNFALKNFVHRAIYNEKEGRIEMYLDCLRSHQVRLESLDLTVEFRQGESILTEISRKFNLDTLEQNVQERGLSILQTQTDDRGWFGVILCQK
ncbi:L-histidine N(alpha)-methyltransferase [Spirulina sp. 06S082]|uniref:L-histidine N(alpha)-methyltransferase n=1 Tax=Spirulina sp. 06S082 TaxID=3110248 RepID=UPI002B1F91CE|nr:L-histidine N(alpha)-methyltransferase [Spirulina sp. 06S082]MEA5470003.1 L-histidine N(alpha)-methyltransferase [Spirulina sp. 06S082]